MKIDLHVHTNKSDCGKHTLLEMVKRAESIGLSGIAITDHDTLAALKEVKKVKTDLMIIRGEEINTIDGALSGLGLSEKIPRDLGLQETADRIREQGGVAVVPHPFDFLRHAICGKIRKIKPDAIETINGRCPIEWFNKEAEEYANKHKLSKIAGSDAHLIQELGNAYTIFKRVSSVDDVLKAIKKGNCTPAGSTAPPLMKAEIVLHRLERFAKELLER